MANYHTAEHDTFCSMRAWRVHSFDSPDSLRQIKSILKSLSSAWKAVSFFIPLNVFRASYVSVPRIALLLVSDVGPMSEWHQPRQLDAFKKGIIKAANTTHMWIFTNGLNTGIAKEIGDAVAEELSRRRAKKCHKHPARKKQHKPPLTLVSGSQLWQSKSSSCKRNIR